MDEPRNYASGDKRMGMSEGGFVDYSARDVSPDMSFLEMLDIVNEELIAKGEEPIAFDHDCREGICGSCGLVINGCCARPTESDNNLPVAYEVLHGWSEDHNRTVASAPHFR